MEQSSSLTARHTFLSPLGLLTVECRGEYLTALRLGAHLPEIHGDNALLRRAQQQLNLYFTGVAAPFDLPMAPVGTAFQLAVWQALRAIPYGQTRTYAWLAQAAGHPGACRAEGSAAGKNPLPILIPCHRILRTGGSLGGFALGLDKKRILLELEHG